MKRKKKNPNHPRKGSRTKVEPIREHAAIEAIKALLKDNPRDRCLFTLGINTAYRASELRSIECKQVAHLKPGDELDVWQPKTKKRRITILNHAAVAAIQDWLSVHPDSATGAPLFQSKSGKALTVPTMCTMVKGWCRAVGLRGNYSSHSLRKTWGYHQLRMNDHSSPQMVLPILMRAYGHARQEQTLEYLCVQSQEIADLYMRVEL